MQLADYVADQQAAQIAQAQLIESRTGQASVHKFGGSSLGSANAINRVADIIARDCQARDFVILSAMGKTTDMLFELVKGKAESIGYSPDFSKLHNYQSGVITELLPASVAEPLLQELSNDLQRIEFLLTHSSDSQRFNRDDIICYGELWSTRIVTAVLQHRGLDCQRVDARDLIHVADPKTVETTNIAQDSVINWSKSAEAFARWSDEFSGKLAIVSGYIASDHLGNTITLGRNGSDFSATIVAKLAKAGMVYLWTDVNGVFSADPNRFNETKVIPLLGLNEANALANLGTPVFHEKTLKPLQDANIPIRIRNSQANDETSSGTLILTHAVKWRGAKTLALKEAVCLFSIQWHEADLHDELCRKLAQLLYSLQISSYCWLNENRTLYFCVREQDHTDVAKLLTRQSVGAGCQFSINKDLSIISLVGYELLQHGEHLSAYYSLIQQSQKGVLLYHYDANGAISTVINDKHPVQLVASIHHAIFANQGDDKNTAPVQTGISVVLMGYGNIGRKVIEILNQRLEVINHKAKTKLKVVGICNSTSYIFDAKGLNLVNAEEQLAHSPLKVANIERDLQLIDDTQLAIIDCTANKAVSDSYGEHFSKGRHIISANKLGLTGTAAQFEYLTELTQNNQCRWLSNVTCCAGLPIQQSITELSLSGDTITAIEGVFSGTLSWILHHFDGKSSFTDVVAKANQLGLTEPDPRDDLSGKDVQRKLLILARTMGLKLELSQIQLTPLIPLDFLDLSEKAFAENSAEVDDYMNQKWQQASAQGLKLCYCGELVFSELNGQTRLREARVGLSFRESNDPLVNIAAADNIAVIHSQWHDKNPLILRGPGAGIEVTAAGVVADLIRLAL